MKGFRFYFDPPRTGRCLIRKTWDGWWKGECLDYGIVCADFILGDCYSNLMEKVRYYRLNPDFTWEGEAPGGKGKHTPVKHFWLRKRLFDLAMWWEGKWEQYTENRRWDKAMRMNKDPNTCWWLLCSWVQERDKETRRMLWQEGFSVSRCYPGNPFCSPGDYGCGKCDPELKNGGAD